MRNDDDRCLEWFQAAQGFRQGCVLSSLLFNVFAAILLVALKRLSEDSDILADLAHLTLKRHWNVGGMLFRGFCMLTTRPSCRDCRAGWGFDDGVCRSLRRIWFDHLREKDGDHSACTGNADSLHRHGTTVPPSPIWEAPSLKLQTLRTRSTGGSARAG